MFEPMQEPLINKLNLVIHLFISLLHQTTIVFVVTAIILCLQSRITRTIQQYFDTVHNFIKQKL